MEVPGLSQEVHARILRGYGRGAALGVEFMTYDEGRTSAECQCGATCSDEYWRVEMWADEHERENPGHRVDIQEPRRGE